MRAPSFSPNALWRTYTPADGLVGSTIKKMVQDNDGFLWLSSFRSGVSRFDGESFTSITRADGLCGNFVHYVLKDRAGKLWFATLDGGVCWYEGRTFQRLDMTSTSSATFLFEDRSGLLWIGGEDLLLTWDGKHARDLRPHLKRDCGLVINHCWGMTQDNAGHIWIGASHLLCFDGQHFCTYGPQDGLPEVALAHAVCRDPDGDIWVGGKDQIVRFNGQSFQPILATAMGQVHRICCDNTDIMWVGSTGSGAYYSDGESFQHLSVAEGLPSLMVLDVLRDSEGLYWFATDRGVSCCDLHFQRMKPEESHVSSKFQSSEHTLTPAMHTLEDGFSVQRNDEVDDSIWSLCADSQNRLWMASANGLLCWDGQYLKNVDATTELGLWLQMAIDGNDCPWIARANTPGLLRWDGQQLREAGGSLADLKITALSADRRGRLLVGHLDKTGYQLQISRFDGEQFDLLLSCDGPEAGLIISRIAAGKNDTIWFLRNHHIGLPNDKIPCLGQVHSDGSVRWFLETNDAIDDVISDLLEDQQGQLWAATNAGLYCYDGNQFRHFAANRDQPTYNANSLYEDHQGHIWVGCESCIVRYDGRRFHLLSSSHITSTINGIAEDKAGHFWFASPQGMVRYIPEKIPPRIRLLRSDTQDIESDTDTIEVSTSHGKMSIEYQGMSSRMPPGDMLYSYRFVGVDPDWQPATRQRQIHYADLVPGQYRFEVIAIDRDLNESQPAEVQINIVPNPKVEALTLALNASSANGDFVGESTALRQVQAQLREVAKTDLTVLIQGETGTGKGLAARLLHKLSSCQNGPLIQVNCGALPESLVESELFGHEKGAFTGAIARKLGKVELANGGTLFLDEIGDMPLEAQVKLLQLLEERTFERVGGTQILTSDARIVAATNRNLVQCVDEGRFREDLYYRLLVFPVQLPPLRERREDIPLLAFYFAQRMAQHLSKQLIGITPAALSALQSHPWPGNVRELEHTLQRAVIVCRDVEIGADDLVMIGDSGKEKTAAELVTLAEHERRYIQTVLEKSDWIVRGECGAAAILGMHEATLRFRMKKYGIVRPEA
jgi:DNA-binding NtrC family response regulator/ligand-binding sensor domain-containing protein